MSEGRRLARNSALNLLGYVAPLLLAILTIPPLVRGLGSDRFGILTLVWAAIGYFSLFDMGISRALTQAIAERLGRQDNEELGTLSWSALIVLLGFGIAGGVLTAAVSPLLVTRVLNVPPTLQHEAVIAFDIVAAALPFVVTSIGLRGVMEAHQHFGMATALRVPLVGFTLIGPLLVLPFSHSLVPAVVMLAIGRVIGSVAHLVICLRRYEYFGRAVRLRLSLLKPLLRFGGWTTITNLVSPAMVFLDRFVIGAVLPIAAVTAYVTPYELITKFLMVPGAILGAIFPAFASAYSRDDNRMARLYDRSLRAVLLTMFPVAVVTIVLARQGLALWMGAMLTGDSAVVLQWLALGVFINALAQPPYAALQGAARPEVIAKLHLVELPAYAVTVWVLVHRLGIIGVAIAWTLRVTVDTVALLVIARMRLGLAAVPTRHGGLMIVSMLGALGIAALVQKSAPGLAFLGVALSAFAWAGWSILLTPSERAFVRRQRHPNAPATKERNSGELVSVPPT